MPFCITIVRTTNNFLPYRSQRFYPLSIPVSIWFLLYFANTINKICKIHIIHTRYISYYGYYYVLILKKSGNNRISLENHFQHIRIPNGWICRRFIFFT